MSQSTPANPDPKEIAGRYEVVRKLGAGAFGTVYQVKDTTLGRELAIKTIRLEGLAAASVDLEELLKRFKQEAMAGAKLKHPNIVTIYDYGESGGQAFLAMEYVEGVGLDRLIREAGKLPEERAASISAHVADALGYAHQRNIVHRDIKPANIMIEPGERVKVTDFGVARLTDSAEQLTATGGVIGTPSYMSPEQARGQKVDGRSDLFSVGCVLYELLAGQKAFTGENITGIIFKIITEDPPALQEHAPFVSDEMVRIVKKSLAKEPTQRYQTGQEMAADLFALTQPGHVPTVRQADVGTKAAPSGDVPTIATPPTASGTISSTPTVARPATAPAAGATAPPPPTQLMPDSPATAPPPLPAEAPAARRPTPARPRREPEKKGGGRGLALAAIAVLVLAVGGLGAWMVLGRRSAPPPDAAATTDTTPPTTTAQAPAPAGEVPVDPPGGRAGTTPTPAPAAPSTATQAPPPPTAAAQPPPAQPAPRAAPPTTTPPTRQAAAAPPPAPARQPAPPPPDDDAFLDELPAEAQVDSRAAAEALAGAYSSEGNRPRYGATGSYARRPRIPRDIRPPEAPAVRGLAWILSAQKAHHQKTGRYGTLDELVDSGDLPLTGRRTADGFDRKEYRFRITSTGDEFRADATPLSPRGRAFYTDQNGFVLHNR